MAADVADLEALEWRVRGAEGEWYERHTISQDLPQLATDALVAGWDTRSLRVLAREPPNAFSLDLVICSLARSGNSGVPFHHRRAPGGCSSTTSAGWSSLTR